MEEDYPSMKQWQKEKQQDYPEYATYAAGVAHCFVIR